MKYLDELRQADLLIGFSSPAQDSKRHVREIVSREERMRYLLLPVLFVMFVATPAAHVQGLEDFKTFSRAIGKEVSVVDRSGPIREGIVEAANADAVTLRFGSARESFPRARLQC